jgi:hypothetical protein
MSEEGIRVVHTLNAFDFGKLASVANNWIPCPSFDIKTSPRLSTFQIDDRSIEVSGFGYLDYPNMVITLLFETLNITQPSRLSHHRSLRLSVTDYGQAPSLPSHHSAAPTLLDCVRVVSSSPYKYQIAHPIVPSAI